MLERCINCFESKENIAICPYCNYNTEKANVPSLYLPPGAILAGKYAIGKVLGQGGFGITYVAWDLNLEIRVAIKEFFPQGFVSRLPGENRIVTFTSGVKDQFTFGVESFLREAKTLARFEHHPNIVTIRDFFKENGTAYMVMSYLEGLTLEEYLTREGGKLPFNKTIAIMMPVMDALREVHEMGIMHRDISPDNIFIDNKGRVVLIDFGAARQELREKSKSLSVILKAGYAPEEQYRSRGKQGPWSDVYAVGATIYRSITGQVPPEAMDRLSEEIIVLPTQLGVEIEPTIELALLKALAVKAEHRYQTVVDFQDALKGVVQVFNNSYYLGSEKLGLESESLVNIGENNNDKPAATSTCPKCMQPMNPGDKKCKYCKEELVELQHKNVGLLDSKVVDIDCPVEVEATVLVVSKKKTKVLLTFNNYTQSNDGAQTEKDRVVALKLKIYCYDTFNDTVTYQGSNMLYKAIQGISIKSGGKLVYEEPIILNDHANTSRVNIVVESILYANDLLWKYNEDSMVDLNTEVLDGEELRELRKLTDKDAICYGRLAENYWQCICGRGNSNSREYCMRCKRERRVVLDLFSSKTNVEQEILKLEKLQEEERLQKAQAKEAERIDYPNRPFWKKIIGFRSLTPWKMILSSIYYIAVVSICINYFSSLFAFYFISIMYIAVAMAALTIENKPKGKTLIALIGVVFIYVAIEVLYLFPKSGDTFLYYFDYYLIDHLATLIIANFAFAVAGLVFCLIEEKEGPVTYIYLAGVIVIPIFFIFYAVSFG